jgi:flap endonuclease-1
MGIKNLTSLLKTSAPNSIKEVKITDLSSKILVVDVSILIYQHIIAIKNTNLDLTNKEGTFTAHIQGLISKILFLTTNKVKPIFVFDGKPSTLKNKTIKARAEAKAKVLEKMEDVDSEEKMKLSKQTLSIGKQEIEYAKRVIKLLGLPYIEAPEEADPQCAYLIKNKSVYGVFTEDMDLLTFGSTKVYRNLSANKKKDIIEYDLKKILKELDITYESFVDLCILLGTDYTDTIKGIGKMSALKLIKEHSSIENILKSKEYELPENFDYVIARKYFMNPIGKDLPLELKWTRPKWEEFKLFMKDELQFSEKKVDNFITKLKTVYSKANIYYN